MIVFYLDGLCHSSSILKNFKNSDVRVTVRRHLNQLHAEVRQDGQFEEDRNDSAHECAIICVAIEVDVDYGAEAVTLS